VHTGGRHELDAWAGGMLAYNGFERGLHASANTVGEHGLDAWAGGMQVHPDLSMGCLRAGT